MAEKDKLTFKIQVNNTLKKRQLKKGVIKINENKACWLIFNMWWDLINSGGIKK